MSHQSKSDDAFFYWVAVITTLVIVVFQVKIRIMAKEILIQGLLATFFVELFVLWTN